MTRKNILIFAIAIVSTLAASKLVAEDNQQYPITWDPVPGAGGYRIELQNSKGDTLLSRTVGKDVLEYSFHLQSGSYRFRVTTLSVAMLDEGATDWFPIVVENLTAPKITEIQPKEILTDKGQVITLAGRHFARQLKAQLIDPAGKKSLLKMQKFSINKIELLIPPLKQAGTYGILLANSDKYVTIEEKALRVRYPAPVFGSLQPAAIRLGIDETNFSFRADKLATEAKVMVMPHAVDPSIADSVIPVTATVGKNGLQAALDPSVAAGDYDVYVVNHSDEAPVLVGTLSLIAPPTPSPVPQPQPVATPPAQSAVASATNNSTATEPPPSTAPSVSTAPALALAPTPIATPPATVGTEKPKSEAPIRKVLIGAGWQYGLPLNEWGNRYNGTPQSALLRIDCFLTPFDRPASGSAWDYAVGLDARYARFSNPGSSSLVASSLSSFAFAIDPSLTWSLPWMSIRARAGGGIAYSSLKADSSTGDSSTINGSFDFIGMGELAFEFPIVRNLRLGISADYTYLFLTTSMELLSASTYVAYAF
jgi:hypothetical protein